MRPDNKLPWRYYIYGLHLAVDRALPGLDALDTSVSVDVFVHWAIIPGDRFPAVPDTLLYAHVGRTEQGENYLKVWRDRDGRVHVRRTHGVAQVHFIIASNGRDMDILATQSMPDSDIATYFLGPVMGCLLRVRRITCLHAGVIAVGDTAIAVIGPKQAGKSTTIAAFAGQGYPLLTDDIATLEAHKGTWMVPPGYPRMRLWPATIEAVSDRAPDTLDRVESSSEKRYMNLTTVQTAAAWKFQTEPLPLSAIYFLERDESATVCTVTAVSVKEGLMALVRNTYADYMLDASGRQRDFDALGRLAVTVPVRRLHRPDALHQLSQLCETILDDFKAG